jgi:hypothetical protein
MNFNDRFKYYLGDFFDKTNIIIKLNNKYETFKQDEIYYYLGPDKYPPNFKFDHGCVNPCWWWYDDDFKISFPCLTNSADGYKSNGLPVLTKARIIKNKNNGILLKLSNHRHWSILNNFKDPYTWENKENEIIWRGTSYSSFKKKNNRFTFVKKYYDKHNIGFSDKNPSFSDKFYKGYLNIDQQLKYKYLISLEGNDVATGLKWMLYSNSVVIMSKPVIEGWLMEGLLKPYVHYVPLKNDFSDLEEVLEWCIKHDHICKRISENATEWMVQFLDHNNELKLHNLITEWYVNNINFIV